MTETPLPSGWTIEKLANVVVDAQSGFASGDKAVEGGVPQLRMNNIGADGALFLDLIRTVPKKLAKQGYTLKYDDVLVCTTNSSKLVGKTALFNLHGRYVFSNHLTRLRPNADVVDGHFLHWNLWLHWKRGGFEDKCKHWVNQSTIPKDELLATEIALPPLAEQRRIAIKLEKVLEKTNRSVERLERILSILKHFRQSVLAAACSGRLTAEWRKQHLNAQVSPALRQRIATTVDIDVPRSWLACSVRDVMMLKGGYAFKSGDYSEKGIPLVRISNIQHGHVTLENCAKIPSEIANWNFSVEPGNLLVAMSGATTGKFGIYRGTDKCLQNQRVGNITITSPDDVTSGYRNIYLLSLQRTIEEEAYGGAQPNVSPSKIEALPFACPPYIEQQEIVRRVESLFTLADQLEARYKKGKAYVDKLTQSILAKAFRGELVPQDPNDEPAEKLLAGIRSQQTSRKKGSDRLA